MQYYTIWKHSIHVQCHIHYCLKTVTLKVKFYCIYCLLLYTFCVIIQTKLIVLFYSFHPQCVHFTFGLCGGLEQFPEFGPFHSLSCDMLTLFWVWGDDPVLQYYGTLTHFWPSATLRIHLRQVRGLMSRLQVTPVSFRTGLNPGKASSATNWDN